MKNMVLLIIVALSLRVFGMINENDSDKKNGLDFIKSNNLLNKVSYFASPELEGRLAGSPGYYKAAEYSASVFNKIGLQKPTDSYFQYFEVEYNEIKEPILFELIDKNRQIEYKLGKDFVFRGFTGSGDIKADVVFCGYGLSDSFSGYDDYKDIDVNGKIVMVFKYNPRWRIGEKPFANGNPREKSAIAAQHGAIGILFVSLPNDVNPQKTIGSTIAGNGEQDLDFPQLHVDLPAANDFFANSNTSLNELQTKIDKTMKPASLELNCSAKILVDAKYDKYRKTMNIIGVIPGTDEKLKDEYVILGAHLDHVGKQGDTLYFPGANDNASGAAALIEIASAFKNANIQPKRSIVFILFSSEEAGLLGAEFYTKNPIFPLDKTVAMLNMDCIGYGDSIQIGNGKSSPILWKMAKKIDDEYFDMSVDNTWSGGGADAAPFHNNGIPALYFVTTNSYEHLHYMTDKPETLNKILYEKITKLAYLTLYEISTGNYKREVILK